MPNGGQGCQTEVRSRLSGGFQSISFGGGFSEQWRNGSLRAPLAAGYRVAELFRGLIKWMVKEKLEDYKDYN